MNQTLRANLVRNGSAVKDEQLWHALLERRAKPGPANPVHAKTLAALEQAGLTDPFRVTAEAERHIENLRALHRPDGKLATAILIFRSVIAASQTFSFNGQECAPLAPDQGGLNISFNADPNVGLRRFSEGFIDFHTLLKSDEYDRPRVAMCIEYSVLLITFLRAAGIEAHLMSGGYPGHVVVAAKIDGDHYRLDAAYLKDKVPPRFEKLTPPVRYFSERIALADCYSSRAETLRRQCQHDAAFKFVSLALAIAPDFAAAWVNLGAILSRDGKQSGSEQAHQAYDRALELEPDNAVALNAKGTLLARSRQRAEAEVYFKKALAADPTYEKAKKNLKQLTGQLDLCNQLIQLADLFI